MPAAYGKKFTELTESDIDLIRRSDLTNDEICVLIGIQKGTATLSRWRKRLGVVVPKGSKKGKSKPWQSVRETRHCLVCNAEFEVIPSSPKKLCGKSCADTFNKFADKSYMQTEEYRATKRKPDTPAYQRYKNRVHRLSEQTYKNNSEIINPFNHPRTIAGVEGGYQLDHIIPVRFGFDNNIPEEVMAEVENLRMLTWQNNLKRNRGTC